MKTWEKLTSEDAGTIAKGLDAFIPQVLSRHKKKYARTAERYYRGEHDILDAVAVTVDEYGEPMDTATRNFLIPHPFLQELVDQKTQYLLANGLHIEVAPDKDLQWLEDELLTYYDSDFKLHLNELTEGASIKGVEYAYVRTNSQGELKFETSSYLNTDTVFNELAEEVAVIRYYDRTISDGDKDITVEYAEVWTPDKVAYFIKSPKDKGYTLDTTIANNPRAHIEAHHIKQDGLILERSYGRIPFYRLTNNRLEASDLKPIKPLIDDYDRIASTMSSVIENFDRPLWFVYGANDEDLRKFKKRVKDGGVVGLRGGGDSKIDMHHFTVDVNARKEKLQLNKENIYKFGMGFDSSQTGDGNITNVVIRSRYTALDLKCNKLEPRLLAYLKWTLEIIREDIKRKSGRVFDLNDVTFSFKRNVLFNETDSKRQENIEANTKATQIQTVLMAQGVLDDETIIRMMCDTFDLDFSEVMALVDENEFEEGVELSNEIEQVSKGIAKFETPTFEGDGDDT